ncbi:MAG: glycosyltransferase family 2 protein [bacterium]|nr:glycosyltransferase family 2 protein [bacterium]
MKLSLCIATYNEEQFIHYPLDSAYDIADEVIVVDGGSEDKTVEIARSYGDKVKVFVTNNPPMFHANKQKAIEKAKGEWILQLDADEALSEDLKKEILDVLQYQNDKSNIKNDGAGGAGGRVPDSVERSEPWREGEPRQAPQNYNAYYISRKNWFLNRFLTKGGAYPDYTIRLYKNGKAHFPCESVHENVKVVGEIEYLQSPIFHYADPEFSRYLARWNRYTSLDADMLIKEKKKPSFLSYFFIKPTLWFLTSYIRYQGFRDGFPGFVFSLFSSIRFWGIYIKWWSKMRS